MATTNPFDLLGDDDNDDPSLLLAAQQHKVAAAVTATKKAAPAAAPAKPKLPAKPLSQPAYESRNEGERGRGRGGGRGYGRGGRGGYRRDSDNGENTSGNDNGVLYRPSEDKPSERRSYSDQRGGYRGGRRGGFSNGEATEGERPRRVYERRSGTGHGFAFFSINNWNDLKRDGSGRGNWGAPGEEMKLETEETAGENEANVATEKQVNDEDNVGANKENPANEAEEKEPEDKEMTLEEYEKILEEKRKALLTLKVKERKVDTKEFESMQLLSKKNVEEEIFIKLGSDKDKRKEATDKEEKAKKSVSINEFLKPAEGESYYRQGGRGRGRGRGQRGGGRGYEARAFDAPAPSIADSGHFPSLK